MKKFAIAATLALVALPGALRAADMPELPPIIKAPQMPWLEFGSNWYLRGDFAYRMSSDPTVTDGTTSLTGTVADTAVLGIGVGYKLNDWLRTDITADYGFKGQFRGSNGDETTLRSMGFFWNAYIDMGTWWGVTPYVGAGIGASYLSTSAYTDAAPLTTYPGGSVWNFAWAGMAGAAYHFTPNLALDLNYRYVDLGNFQATPYGSDSITAHEFRIGFRYLID